MSFITFNVAYALTCASHRIDHALHHLASSLLLIGILALVICIYILLFLAKISLRTYSDAYVGGFEIGGLAIPIIQAILMLIFEGVFRPVAVHLNNYENHRIDTLYEKALITKVMIFRFVNNFTPLFYIAFVKPWIQDFDQCTSNDCLKELQISLGAIFFTRLIIKLLGAVILPFYRQSRIRKHDNKNGAAGGYKFAFLKRILFC